MAAVFRKSGNRKFRKKNFATEEGEEDTNENQSTDNNVINTTAKTEKVKSASKIEKTFSSNSLLSFDHADNEEETEVFQVKKSKESRRLSKKASKEKSKKTKAKFEIKEEEIDDDGNEKSHENSPAGNEIDSGKLEALRAELKAMSKDDDEDDEDENNGDESPEDANKPVLFARRNEFNIPDAATIHALKKKREMARQLGTGQEYIPLDEGQKHEGKFDSQSRLIREDENDASDDEGPISFSAVKNEQPAFTKVASEDEEETEEDEETKRWENEQIHKGVSASQLQQEKEQQAYGVADSYQAYNIYPYGGGYSLEITQTTSEPTTFTAQHKTLSTEKPTLDSIVTRLKNRLESIQDTHRGRRLEKDKIISHSEVSAESIEKLQKHGREVEQQYSFYQEMRGYVRDLIECINEKAPIIESLEKQMLELLKQRAQRWVERRQEDVKDQSDEFLALQTGKPQSIKPVIDEYGRDMTMYVEETKRRRNADREGRRMRRRRKRELEGTHVTHHEGMSSDEEETEIDSRQFKAESERIIHQSKNIFEDVVDNFSSINAVKVQFERWKDQCGDSYKNAYISLCLPKLFAMFARIELIEWNPLIDDSLSLESMQWYINLVGFGFHHHEEIDPQDDDVKVIPSLIEKAVIPKLIELVQNVWDPLSSTQSKNLVTLIQSLAEDYPTVQADNKTTRQLFTAIITRLRKSVNDDVYVPLYPKQLLENKTSGALAFFQRQYWACYKLFTNILLWDGILSTSAIQQLALDGLLNRYIILGLQHSSLYYDSLEKAKLITQSIPKTWLSGGTDNTLPTLETFTRFLTILVSCIQRSSAGCSDVEKKKARSATKKIIQYLLTLKAKGKATTVALDYDLEEMIE